MFEARYYRDYGHNYMVLQCRQQEAARSYQYKILTSGKIGEILRCSVRYINGSTYYYYDISSRTTLEGLYRGKKMSCAQVKDVLYQIRGICEKLAEYFMEETGLVLLPEHIYYDLTDKKYVGLYYPDNRTEESCAYKPLMDFLLEHIDTEDRGLAEIMYRICEMAEENYFFIEDALQILEEGQEPVQERLQEIAQEMPQETIHEMIQKPARVEDWGQVTANKETYNDMEEFQKEEEHKKISPKRNPFYPVFAILSVFGIAGAATVCSIYELTQRKEIILYGFMAAMGVCLLLCLAGFFSDRRRKAVPEGNFDKESDDKYNSDEVNLPSLDQVIDRDMNLEMAGYTSASVRSAYDAVKPLHIAGSATMQGKKDYGNTVFFDESSVKEYKLYAIDKKNKKHIELKQFPCTIGKMAGCVDYVLSDDSVSRIHARFDKQGEKVMLTDMNSTNGTFKNGLRMQPQETVEIEPGDEVRFGSLNYCYR